MWLCVSLTLPVCNGMSVLMRVLPTGCSADTQKYHSLPASVVPGQLPAS